MAEKKQVSKPKAKTTSSATQTKIFVDKEVNTEEADFQIDLIPETPSNVTKKNSVES